MTARLGGLMMAGALALGACARSAPQLPQLPVREVIVLAAEPESGQVGRMLVRTSTGEMELAERGASTTLVAGRSPGAVVVMSDAEIQQLFGSALAIRPPAARRFDLYFETGTDTLTRESRGRVAELVEAVVNRVAPDVSIIGHTDTTGTAASNVDLGLRRASLLRTLLVEAGLDPGVVEVTSHGETDPLVPTPDETAEARNRRVEVIVR
jgi:outer membrane protein OmpA-like peptidoglycan-associated protein